MGRIAKVMAALAALGMASAVYSGHNTPQKRLARAQAKLKAMERQEVRDKRTRDRAIEHATRMQYMRPERFPAGTTKTGRRLYHEDALDKLADAEDAYRDKRALLEAQREEVRRLERAANP